MYRVLLFITVFNFLQAQGSDNYSYFNKKTELIYCTVPELKIFHNFDLTYLKNRGIAFNYPFDGGLDTVSTGYVKKLNVYASNIKNTLISESMFENFRFECDSLENLVFRNVFSKRMFCFIDNYTSENFYFKQGFFDQGVKIVNSEFTGKVTFFRCCFAGEINFENSRFQNSLDLRNNDFSKVTSINLTNIKCPIGNFYVDWQSLKASDDFKIKVPSISDGMATFQDSLKELKFLYDFLSMNYKAQNNMVAADEVMFEYENYHARLKPTFWHSVYKHIMGFGYRPIRFLIIVLPTVFLFTLFYYFYYLDLITKINFKTAYMSDALLITKIWIALYFSFSVLLSFRFRREWITLIHTENLRSFVLIVSFQYFLGIFYYVLFFILAKGNYFYKFKSLIGL